MTDLARPLPHPLHERLEDAHPQLLRFCHHLTGNLHQGEDLAQEAMLRALVAPPAPINLQAWLRTVASRLFLDAVRARKGRANTMRRYAGRGALVDVTESAEDALKVDPVERAHLVAALAKLTPQERRIIWLRDAEGWELNHIARSEGRSVDAIRNLAWRARRKLRATLRGALAWLGIAALRETETVTAIAAGTAVAIVVLGLAISAPGQPPRPPRGLAHEVPKVAATLGDLPEVRPARRSGARAFMTPTLGQTSDMIVLQPEGDGLASGPMTFRMRITAIYQRAARTPLLEQVTEPAHAASHASD